MYKKIMLFVLLVMLLQLVSPIENKTVTAGAQNKTNIIIALDKTNDTNISIAGSATKYFRPVLDGYTWIVDNHEYKFIPFDVNTSFICEGGLNNSGFDVFVVAGWSALNTLAGTPLKKFYTDSGNYYYPRDIKNNLHNFVSYGGGYVGHCGGGLLPLGMEISPIRNPNGTINQLVNHWNKFLKGAEEKKKPFGKPVEPKLEVYLLFPSGLPVYSEYMYLDRLCPVFNRFLPNRPELMGTMGYSWYLGWNSSKTACRFGGVPIDLVIEDKDHPIFKDYLNDTWRVEWIGGEGFKIGDDDKITTSIARYPPSFEHNESTDINAWSYNGSISKLYKLIPNIINLNLLVYKLPSGELFINATDWVPTDIPIKLKLSEQSALVTFTYPDTEDGGRFVLCGPHPECKIWSYGELEPYNDTSNDSLWNGLIHWVDENGFDLNESELKEDTSKWFLRREVAWASKQVADDRELPPVYGRSQAVDIVPMLHDEDAVITIKCCVGKEPDEGDWVTQNLS